VNEFEWDPAKNAANLRKHGIDFPAAARVIDGPVITRRSAREGEERWLAIGDLDGREIAVAYTMRGAVCRIISARRARKYEREEYRARYPE
jgi:uncharacterized DUF497 family protein